MKKYKFIILFSFLFFLIVFLGIACSLEENVLFNNKNQEVDYPDLPKVVATDDEVTITGTSDPIDTGSGLVMFEIELNAILKQKELSAEEKKLISDIIDYLKTGNYLIEKVTTTGYKNSYYDKEKTQIAYKNIYHKTKYFIKNKLSYETPWEYQKTENQNGVLFSVDGGNNNSPYCLVSVDFEEGTGWHRHRSTFSPNNTQWGNVWSAINYGVSGSLYFDIYGDAPSHVHPTGEIITNTFLNLLITGRLKLLSGSVVEAQDYRDTATEVLSPYTLNSGDSITLRLYTEDENDFDYNDSFITITVTNGLPPVVSVNDEGMVVVNYGGTSEEDYLGDINNIDIFYRHGSSESWIELNDNNITIENNKVILDIPNLASDTEVQFRERL